MNHEIEYRSIQKIDFFTNFFIGGIVPIIEVILMLILIKTFNAGTWEKTTLSVMVNSSYFIAIPLSFFVFRRHIHINHAVSFICLAAGISLGLLAWVETVWIFLVIVPLAVLPYNGLHGLLSEFYNYYPRENRGKLYFTSNLGLFIGGVMFSLIYNYQVAHKLGGRVVVRDVFERESYSMILITGAVCLLLTAVFTFKLPRITFTGLDKPSLKNWFKILKEDKLFFYVLVAWYLLGTANLWILSYRTNLLVEKEFGFQYDESTVLLLLILIPQLTYLVFHYPFALFFDRYNIIVLRIMINIFMGLYIGFFFMSHSIWGQILGAFFYGIFTSGGSLAWKLWIYKVVPKNKVSTYMNIHTAFTGLRKTTSPLLGLIGLYNLGPTNAALISLLLLSISTIMMFFLIPLARKKFIY